MAQITIPCINQHARKEQNNGNKDFENPDLKLDTDENDNTIVNSIHEVMVTHIHVRDTS